MKPGYDNVNKKNPVHDLEMTSVIFITQNEGPLPDEAGAPIPIEPIDAGDLVIGKAGSHSGKSSGCPLTRWFQ
ncbi:hypothetical protein [Burkholderia plantarii]|uniref:hypothetical protein n=1 Tax=Burkholderia plantarii TaxID=41899 RepID=UPI000F500E2B|nr:hypothetical protein [Burkholderia plantarii]